MIDATRIIQDYAAGGTSHRKLAHLDGEVLEQAADTYKPKEVAA